MKQFEFKLPTRVRFGVGITAQLGKMLKDMGYGKIFISTGSYLVTTPVIDAVKASLEDAGLPYAVYSELKPDPTIEQVDAAADALRSSGADAVVAVGGGSTIDTSKAMCMLQTHGGSVRDYLFGGSKSVVNPIMPLIVVPTTAGSGSEVTAASVITDMQNEIKLSVTHENLIPGLAVIDPLLHVGMSPFVTATTGMDALTHAVESYVSLNAEPFSDALALQAMRLVADNLRTATSDGSNIEARANMAMASTMGAAAFMNGGLGVVHGISQAMGGVAHISHGAANALILPYAMKRNCIGNLEKFKNIASILGEKVEGIPLRKAAGLAAEAVIQLNKDLGIPIRLSDPQVNITKNMFPKIIEGTMGFRLLALNPCRMNARDIENILNEAYE